MDKLKSCPFCGRASHLSVCDAGMIEVIEGRVAVREYECSKCGMSWVTVWAYDFSYCPYCGRMIENADE